MSKTYKTYKTYKAADDFYGLKKCRAYKKNKEKCRLYDIYEDEMQMALNYL